MSMLVSTCILWLIKAEGYFMQAITIPGYVQRVDSALTKPATSQEPAGNDPVTTRQQGIGPCDSVLYGSLPVQSLTQVVGVSPSPI